ncbi:unnamed protein product, partial [marine sediment metagenome]
TGLAAARPAAGTANRWYYSTDTKVLEYDTGAAWVEAARGESATRLAQLAEKAHSSLTGVTAAQHHAKYTNTEARTTVKANVEVGDLKAPTKALQMNNQDISGVKDLTATKIIATTEMYIPAEP